jgi:pyrimidine operon attenuation protein/uracil phosphoribosyltransferase
MIKKELLSTKALNIILNRLACELVENHRDFSDTVLIGLQPRGGHVLKRLVELLNAQGFQHIDTGLLDITFYRDDFRRRNQPLQANQTHINVLLEGKKVVFIDDVLYTGRSVRAALDAIHSFGRPKEIELLVLIDRRFSRELPIQPDYTGQRVDAISTERVSVEWQQEAEKDSVYLLNAHDERA